MDHKMTAIRSNSGELEQEIIGYQNVKYFKWNDFANTLLVV